MTHVRKLIRALAIAVALTGAPTGTAQQPSLESTTPATVPATFAAARLTPSPDEPSSTFVSPVRLAEVATRAELVIDQLEAIDNDSAAAAELVVQLNEQLPPLAREIDA
jgi:hypothetical protein